MAAPPDLADAGVLALPGRRLLEVTGADRIGYLHRMLTQDVAGLAPGHGAAACYLTATGKVLAHLLLWRIDDAGEDRLLLDVAAGASPEAVALLERYVIADDVTFRDLGTTYARLLVAGAPSADAPHGRIAAFEVPGARGWCLALPFGARTALHLICASADAPALAAALGERARPWQEADLDRARVEEGVPWPGAEIDERILPNEARLDDAVSFTKGCYPGQEPVIMARHRGHPSTLLVRLALTDAPAAAAGVALVDGARTVGRLTTVVGGDAGRAQALGFVRHGLAQTGRVLALATGGHARVL